MTRSLPLAGASFSLAALTEDDKRDGARAGRDPATERGVMLLRLWRDHGAEAVEAAFIPALGPDSAARAAVAFDDLCQLCQAMGPASEPRNCADCPIFCGDEARFGALLENAAIGERDRAFEIALGLVRADRAAELVLHATQAGLAVRRALLCEDRRKRALH